MLVNTVKFSGSLTPGLTGGLRRAAPSMTQNLRNLGSGAIGSRGFHTSTPLLKDLKNGATPATRTDGGFLARMSSGIKKMMEAANIKYTPSKFESKEVLDISKYGPKWAAVDESSYGTVSKSADWKSHFVDAGAKAEIKGVQVIAGHGMFSAGEVHVGKATLQADLGVKGLHQTWQSSVSLTGGTSLFNLRAAWSGLDGGLGEAPSLKTLRMASFKPLLSVQLEQRDLQNGTLVMFKLNAANLLNFLGEGLQEGKLPNPGKLLTGENKIFNDKLHQAYRAVAEDFVQHYRALERAGVPERIDAMVEDALGDWRSDGEGWSPQALAMFKRDILNSQVLADVLGLDKEHANALPVYRLAARLFNEGIANGGQKL
ncbi:hypothetical protein ACFWP0_14315 [Achromobacter sp. NPDC058515]|uniref:hypothetical protein n=1 Tax=Achromobacter sp. NPDC058515 TaxID=3346533 RepID=UPI00365BF486